MGSLRLVKLMWLVSFYVTECLPYVYQMELNPKETQETFHLARQVNFSPLPSQKAKYILRTPKNASESYSFSSEFVLVCIPCRMLLTSIYSVPAY